MRTFFLGGGPKKICTIWGYDTLLSINMKPDVRDPVPLKNTMVQT